jgi:hypothetical protein
VSKPAEGYTRAGVSRGEGGLRGSRSGLSACARPYPAMTPEADHHLLHRQGPLQLQDSHPRQVVPGLEGVGHDEHEEGLPDAARQLINQVRPLALSRTKQTLLAQGESTIRRVRLFSCPRARSRPYSPHAQEFNACQGTGDDSKKVSFFGSAVCLGG